MQQVKPPEWVQAWCERKIELSAEEIQLVRAVPDVMRQVYYDFPPHSVVSCACLVPCWYGVVFQHALHQRSGQLLVLVGINGNPSFQQVVPRENVRLVRYRDWLTPSVVAEIMSQGGDA